VGKTNVLRITASHTNIGHKSMTVGEEFLNELGRLHIRYAYFNYEQHQQLKRIDSLEELRSLLTRWKFREIGPDEDVAAIAQRLFPREVKPSDVLWIQVVNLAFNPAGFFLLPPLLPVLCVYLACRGHGRFQYTLHDMLGFMTLFAVILSYELSIATRITFAVFPLRWIAGVVFAVALGAILYRATRKRIWPALSLTIVIECEAIALLLHWFAK